MKIAFIGKFVLFHDEEYIARSFEMLGHKILRLPQHMVPFDMNASLISFKPDILLYCKWEAPKDVLPTILKLKREGMKTVCWLFDLYFGYHRENQLKTRAFFRSDFVFTTDAGHQKEFLNLGIKHIPVRQGIFKGECVLLPFKFHTNRVIFVGSDSSQYPERSKLVREIGADWFGKKDTNELRGMALNELYSRTRIVIGDSFYSPYYWSNRIVETLGRGGFLIHQEVPGLKEEYPYLVTYRKGDAEDLKKKIAHYLSHETERREIVKKNFEWVRDNYTMEKQCQRLLNYIS